MKKYLLLALMVLIAAFVAIAVIAPKTENVERSITINKPVTEVFSYLVKLQNMEEWSPWAKKDTTTLHTYKGAGNTVGSVHYWVSEHKEVGIGEQEITSIIPNKEVYSDLRFKEPFESESQGYLKFNSKGTQTEVTWGYLAEYNTLQAIVMSMRNMDKVLGKDFEQGLTDAKAILEE